MPKSTKTEDKAVLYARFSPRPNAESCDSVERQLEDMRRYCTSNNLQIMAEFSDKALSGADDDRPGMWDAIYALKPGYILVVRTFDRLSRDSTFALHIIRHEIEKRKCKLLAINDPGASMDTPDARLVRAILLAIAEYQREIIRARTRAAMRRYQRNGRKMSYICPYGWQTNPRDYRKMIPHEREQAIIQTIAVHRKNGLSYQKIAKTMTDCGVKNRTGKPWHPQQVKRVLDRLERGEDKEEQ